MDYQVPNNIQNLYKYNIDLYKLNIDVTMIYSNWKHNLDSTDFPTLQLSFRFK